MHSYGANDFYAHLFGAFKSSVTKKVILTQRLSIPDYWFAEATNAFKISMIFARNRCIFAAFHSMRQARCAISFMP